MMAVQMMAAFATTSSVVTICTKAITVPVTGKEKAIPLGGVPQWMEIVEVQVEVFAIATI